MCVNEWHRGTGPGALGWSGGDSTIHTCLRVAAVPRRLHMNPPPKGIREKQKKPLFPRSSLRAVASFKCHVTLAHRKGLLLSATLVRLGPAHGASPPSTHLPIDKAVQRDPRGPHIQGLERKQLPSVSPESTNTPCLPVPVGCGRGRAGNLLPQSCSHSASTPRPWLHARLCAEPWGTRGPE